MKKREYFHRECFDKYIQKDFEEMFWMSTTKSGKMCEIGEYDINIIPDGEWYKFAIRFADKFWVVASKLKSRPDLNRVRYENLAFDLSKEILKNFEKDRREKVDKEN